MDRTTRWMESKYSAYCAVHEKFFILFLLVDTAVWVNNFEFSTIDNLTLDAHPIEQAIVIKYHVDNARSHRSSECQKLLVS